MKLHLVQIDVARIVCMKHLNNVGTPNTLKRASNLDMVRCFFMKIEDEDN